MVRQAGVDASRSGLETLVHHRVVKSVSYGVVVEDGAVHHEMMGLVVPTMDDKVAGLVANESHGAMVPWRGVVGVVLLPLFFDEGRPIVDDLGGSPWCFSQECTMSLVALRYSP